MAYTAARDQPTRSTSIYQKWDWMSAVQADTKGAVAAQGHDSGGATDMQQAARALGDMATQLQAMVGRSSI